MGVSRVPPAAPAVALLMPIATQTRGGRCLESATVVRGRLATMLSRCGLVRPAGGRHPAVSKHGGAADRQGKEGMTHIEGAGRTSQTIGSGGIVQPMGWEIPANEEESSNQPDANSRNGTKLLRWSSSRGGRELQWRENPRSKEERVIGVGICKVNLREEREVDGPMDACKP